MHICMAVAHILHCTFLLHKCIRNSSLKRGTSRRTEKHKEENTMNPLRIVSNWVNYRRTISELSNLSNDTLSDIGVNRYQIRNIAARSFR